MESPFTLPRPEIDPVEQVANALQRELVGLFQVHSVDVQQKGKAISFGGRLLSDAETIYDEIQTRFHDHGYTPLIRHKDGEDFVVAVKGVIDKTDTSNPLINILLFLATILTTLAAGANLAGEDLWGAVLTGSPIAVLSSLLAGLPFTITLLGILGVHEFGHYLASHLHGVRATLPYFIPLPVVGIGTLGAFIQIKSPMTNRKVLFDIGLAGPYAGLVVAIPLLFLGLMLSADNVVPVFAPGLTLESIGTSVFIEGMVNFFTDIPAGRTLRLDPIFFAAWLGFFLTALNLLPAGQLDGGHATYAVLGRLAHGLAYVVVLLLFVVGAFLGSINWFVWAFFILLSGLRHPPPLNDITDVGLPRKVIGVCTIVLFVLIFTPVPFR
ncbi:MAG: site-2 protease family protein [Candidatus Promineifilaceae bacterium]